MLSDTPLANVVAAVSILYPAGAYNAVLAIAPSDVPVKVVGEPLCGVAPV